MCPVVWTIHSHLVNPKAIWVQRRRRRRRRRREDATNRRWWGPPAPSPPVQSHRGTSLIGTRHSSGVTTLLLSTLLTEYMLAAGLWNMTFLCGFSCDFANWQIWTTLHNIFKVIGQEYVVIFKYTGRFCLFSTLSDHTKASQNLKGTKKRNFEVCKITRETTQNAYFEQRVVTHTVPQKGQKRPALNSTIDRAKKFHHFSNLKMYSKLDFDALLMI